MSDQKVPRPDWRDPTTLPRTKGVPTDNHTRKKAVFLKCFECQGYETHPQKCVSPITCPLYPWRPGAGRPSFLKKRATPAHLVEQNKLKSTKKDPRDG